MLRSSQLITRPLARAVPKHTLQRRFASEQPALKGPEDNAFNRERQAVKAHAAATSDTWRKLSIYVTIPCLIIAGVNAYNLWNEHWEHWSHEPPLEERPEYPYMNIRTKSFPWGDGDKTLL
ncbi:Cytochrome c oxidase subunit 6A, mitochondrial [Bachmanniomyces sp. S44760]|nr:Cytochrome c oxidase subunit 6A, mitochondrial [Bachmanniomyces sp. S44760]